MKESASFLSDNNKQREFATPGRVIPRSLAQISLFDGRRFGENSKPLSDVVLEHLHDLSSLGKNRFRCCCIAVAHEDGINWSAESAALAVAASPFSHKIYRIPNLRETQGLPVLERLIGRRKLCRLAARWGFTNRFWILRPWMKPAIVAVSVAIAAALKVADAVLKASQPAGAGPHAILGLPAVWTGAAALAGLGLLQQWLAASQTGPNSQSIKDLAAALQQDKHSAALKALVDDMVSEMKKAPFPRTVIIDGFEPSDTVSRKTLLRYLDKRGESDGEELWLVFEHPDGPRLAQQLLNERANSAQGRSEFTCFEQLLLTDEEKRELVTFLGKDEEVAGFATVGAICRAEREEGDPFESLFRCWRDEHKKRDGAYDALDFLYLLSLTARPGTLFLDPSALRSQFILGSETVRGRALAGMLPDMRPESDEVSKGMTAVYQHFSDALRPNPEGGLLVWPEAAETLGRVAGSLDLQPEALGHLFWCLYWYETVPAREEAFWVRKIVYHLARAEARKLADNATHAAALQQMLDVSLWAVDATLAACLFSNTAALLARAARLIHDSRGDAAHAGVLLEKTWECCALLGEKTEAAGKAKSLFVAEAPPPIGSVLEEANALRQSSLHAVAKVEDDPLVRLFFDSLWLIEAEHRLIGEQALEWFTMPQGAPARDYARVRGAWLALTVSPMLAHTEGSALAQAVQAGAEWLDHSAEELLARLAASRSTGARATELATLSLWLWCQALLVSYRARVLREDHLASLIQAAREAVRAAAEIQRGAARLSPDTDLLSRALVREICAGALISILSACHDLHARHNYGGSDEMAAAMGEVFRAVERCVGYRLPEIRTFEDLLSTELYGKVDDLLKLCIVVWDIFGLTQLRDLLRLRRMHSFAICHELRANDYGGFQNLIESTGAMTEKEDFAGLMANCIMADCLESSAELSAHYLCAAGEVALGGNFGSELKSALALIAVERAHALFFDLRHFLAFLSGKDERGESRLAQALRECSAERITSLVLRFLNAAGRVQDAALAGAVRETLGSAVEGIEDPAARAEARSVLEIHALEQSFRRGTPVNSAQQLLAWSDRKESWLYAWLLDLLIQQGRATAEVRAEAISLLVRDPNRDAFNSYYLLALALAEVTADSGLESGREIVGGYLRAAVWRWEGESQAEANSRVYMMLSRYYPDESAGFIDEAAKWQEIQLHREHLRRLPALAHKDEFFRIFLDYCRWMEFWGLRTDLHRNVPGALPSDQISAAAAAWKEQGAAVPDPMRRVDGHTLVSFEFLWIGLLLFTEPVALDPAYHGYRIRFNDEAHANLPRLFASIVALERLPESIRDLLSSHAERLYNFTVPRGIAGVVHGAA